ncbi:AraC family transcriptional regulator [Acinetobacter sichuanensis]|uniref:AraC family transcriptional regulator n=1 Tax=Acinetobacter TaxID=469 RepID=UPI0025755264|nr:MULTISPECIES: AraC family transcriptional regulator [Acinetobacter]MDM1768112.1 AraC family transcriptional regulator [Acinetobacter sp. 226-4]MDQ9021318.1 AraC family transcriptional regulator [Acinetobacter sichuanensis]
MNNKNAKMQEKSIPLGALAVLPTILEEHGIEPWAFFRQFDIEQSDFKQNLKPLPLQVHGKVLQLAREMLQCDHLGLLMGKKASLANTGPLRFLVLNAATLRDALQSLFHYGQLWYKGLFLSLKEEQGYAGIQMRIEGDAPDKEQLQTAYLVATVSIMEMVLGKSWHPTLVRISYPKPKSAHLYEKLFGCPVWFGQSQHELLFPQKELDQQRSGHDNQLDDFLRTHLTALHDHKKNDLQIQVCQMIEELLPHGDCSIDRVSEYFSVHRFTLYRYLSQQNTSFEILLEQTRKNKAKQLLENSEMSILEIAQLLGYEAQGNFSRAFKRWYGISPRAWRKQLLAI